MKHLLLVALGGGVGAGLRHLVSLATLRLIGPGFPWGTVTVNVAGSFVMGLFIAWLARYSDLLGGAAQDVRYLLATGLLGGFTTFSAFSLDFAVMWERGDLGLAGAYALASVLLSLSAVFAGLWVMRSIAAW
ncbi:fluoride efflux transporter CrcB [Breoghania sp. L-A4]|uniref:fluoride efflux transporter CrcB n=1 Tax=Breoghania sp. L-A4 TaxID=2304600 RepID=UPI000E35B5E8|nr:fluoride efflux transporter CrcB [Breoghania sp. L-A4]AXS42637.1 fluoride efflux transporter CrcB [Breoghania sp. L-A4]